MKPLGSSVLFILGLLLNFSAMAQSEGVKPVSYYPMQNWDTSPYKSFQYTTENGYWDWINFRLLYPNGYDSTAQDGEEYPLIVMLHGGGESGRMMWNNTTKSNSPYPKDDPRRDNNDHQLLFGGKEHLKAVESGRFPGFVLFPQNFYGTWVREDGGATYFHDDLRKTMELIEYLVEHLKIDPSRIYIHGLSAGAKGTWLAAARRPDLFAAALPMSGHSNPAWAEQLAEVPLWVFQGELDTNPRAWVTRETVDSVRSAGGEVRYTEYEGVGHNTWSRAFNEDDFFEWMLAQNKEDVTEVNEAPEVVAGDDQTITLPTNSTSFTATATDADGTILTYLWQQLAGPDLILKDSTSATLSLTNLLKGEYVFQVSVKDAEGAMDADEVVLVVNEAQNVAPSVTVGDDKIITLPTNSTSFTANATDPDGKIVSYLWEKIEGPVVTLQDTSTSTLKVSDLVEGNYKFKITVKDDEGATAFNQVGLTVKPKPNELPTLSAGNNKTITLPTDTAFFEAVAQDPDGSIDTYSWKKLQGPASVVLSGQTTARLSLSSLTTGSYSFEISVKDNAGATAKDTVQLTVNPKPNELPVVTAEKSKTITLPTNSTRLSAQISDPDGEIKSILWEKTEGPSAVLSGQTTATLKLSGLEKGTYTFKVTATDNKGGKASDEVILVVNPAANKKPTVEAGEKKEVTLPVASVSFTANASDPEGGKLTYLWRKVKGPKVTLIDTTSAALSVKDLVPGSYLLKVLVTDPAGATAYDEVELIVHEAPNQAPTVSAGEDMKVVLPKDSAKITATAVDPDGSIQNYVWEKISGPTTLSMSGNTTAELSLRNLVQGTYLFKVSVTDNDGAKASDSVSIVVELAPNQGPTVDAGQDQTLMLPENTITFTANATDPDGTISTYLWEQLAGPAASLGETGNAALVVTELKEGNYVFQVTVTDNRGGVAKDQVQLRVEPAANMAPSVNAGADVSINLPTDATTLSATASDPDGQVLNYLWKKVTGPAVSMSNTETAVLALSNLVKGSYTFEVTVTDNGGATASDRVILNVFEAPDENQGPLVSIGPDTTLNLPVDYFVLEGSASDNDGEVVTYLWEQLSGPEVNMSKADTTHVEVVGLEEGEYVFRFTATDNEGAQDSAEVKITVQQLVNAADPEEVAAVAVLAFPNPFSDFINLKLKSIGNEQITVRMFDVQLKEVYQGRIETFAGEEVEHRINLWSGSLQPGTYYIRLQNEKGTFREVLRVVKY